MKTPTGVDELQFYTAVAIGAREIERRAVAELVRITGVKLNRRRPVTGAPKTTTEAKQKEETRMDSRAASRARQASAENVEAAPRRGQGQNDDCGIERITRVLESPAVFAAVFLAFVLSHVWSH